MKLVVPEFETLRQKELEYRKVRVSAGKASARFAGNWNCLDGEHYKTLDGFRYKSDSLHARRNATAFQVCFA